ncbi:HET-domain-containing protein [Mycena sanguinolenta]|uniref:HET-domain-containing protein n=1 Tax=Mycena sanguinolenta TaxID=230812 RepID=A0A8H6XG87_9AGAR|nr:HET-domain-containing protein [Mycena sanguinolenta]
MQESIHVSVRFRVSSGSNGETPKGVQLLTLAINSIPHSSYYIYTKRSDPAASFITARDRVFQLDSPSTYAMAQECLMDCIHNHGRCSVPHDCILPTRVIDCLDPINPKLHVSNGERGQYAALSYVWGENQPDCTTTENIDAYLRHIDPVLLPQTIRDAIKAIHTLGLRYLWVDALCILQDSKEDKSREIAQMRTIFRNAYFTIIAASAHKVSAGFLQNRSPCSPDDITLPFRCPDGKVGTMYLSPVWRQYDGSTEPVNQRAWCLEERLLSPRALVYASHTLQLQCQTSVVNVSNAVCGPMIGQRLPDLLFHPDSELSVPLSPSDRRTLRWAWIDAVGDYTQRVVTKPGDKLVAFAAIAELFQRTWKSEYLAGLWRDSLLQDLLWYKNLETRFARPLKYRAPSWSWAAVGGHVLASPMDDRLDPDSGETQSCDILSCEATPTTPLLPLGKASSGTLRLRAAMLKATWNPDSPMPDLYLPPNMHQETPQEASTLDAAALMTESVHIGCAYPDSTEEVQVVWAVPVLWNEKMQYAAGLIITRAGEERGGNWYRRVGYFHSPENSPGGLGWMLGCDTEDIVLV